MFNLPIECYDRDLSSIEGYIANIKSCCFNAHISIIARLLRLQQSSTNFDELFHSQYTCEVVLVSYLYRVIRGGYLDERSVKMRWRDNKKTG